MFTCRLPSDAQPMSYICVRTRYNEHFIKDSSNKTYVRRERYSGVAEAFRVEVLSGLGFSRRERESVRVNEGCLPKGGRDASSGSDFQSRRLRQQ